ncbi:hypothetical protein CVS30_03880 [Arthrobacter psychrolactophilus]|uniref:Uncharacterized protein n=1 Tax=Arthrobacter psychrolactophilus TaxID=92442 RepID=A0A2V5ITF0_9MICC|nr:DUF6541 family protein [Arthrobacter psychrolactophilus]PYI39808.1 hypothetical protein CVS30_03880 [Arthrobacter psychrolactophilus]
MNWLDTVPTLLAATALIFIPGAVLARTLGARGIAWLAVSAPLSLTLIGAGAIVANLAHVRWSPIVVVALTLGISVVLWGVRYVVEIRRGEKRQPLWVISPKSTIFGLIVGLIVAAVTIGLRLASMFIAPENISQTYDNVFHLNAVRYILDSGNGSSLYLGDLTGSGRSAFYPGAWHDLVALVSQVSGSSIPVSVNATNIILGALVWTISAMYLVTRALGSRPAVYILTGVLAGAFASFPYLLLDFGVLYPNFLALVLLPVAVGLVTDVLRFSHKDHPGTMRALILLVLMTPGLALSHPNAVMLLGAFALPLIAFWLFAQLRALLAKKLSLVWFIVSVVGAAVYTTVLLNVWEAIRPTELASFWPPTQSIAQALGEAVANAPLGRPESWTIICMTMLGIYAVVRSRTHLWVLGVLATGVYFFVVVSAFEVGDGRSFVTGVFYNDSFRLAALLPMAGILVSVFGAVWLFDHLAAAAKATPLDAPRRWQTCCAIGIVAVIGIGIWAQNKSMEIAVTTAQESYTINEEAPLLSSDEASLLSRVDANVPADATVIANPAAGGSLVYALADRHILLPAASSQPTPLESTLIFNLFDLSGNPEVCSAAKTLNAFYVLDFGSLQINEMTRPFPTSEQLEANPGLTLVDEEGPARLYRIDGC